MKRQEKFNKHIILESVLMLFTKTKNIKTSQCLSKLQLAKVGAFLRHSADLLFFLVALCTQT